MNEFEEVLAMEVRRYEHLYNLTLKDHRDQQMEGRRGKGGGGLR